MQIYMRGEYKFANEVDAFEFVNKQELDKSESEEKYVSGPFFMDEKKIYDSIDFPEGVPALTKSWWQVEVEIYYPAYDQHFYGANSITI